MKRNPERDPEEGRSPKGQSLFDTDGRDSTEPKMTNSQTKARDRIEHRSRSPGRNWEQAINHGPDNESLLKVWDRTGSTGRGKGILERKKKCQMHYWRS